MLEHVGYIQAVFAAGTRLPLTLSFDFFFRGIVGVAMARKVQMKTILPDELVYKTHRNFFHSCRLIRSGVGHT